MGIERDHPDDSMNSSSSSSSDSDANSNDDGWVNIISDHDENVLIEEHVLTKEEEDEDDEFEVVQNQPAAFFAAIRQILTPTPTTSTLPSASSSASSHITQQDHPMMNRICFAISRKEEQQQKHRASSQIVSHRKLRRKQLEESIGVVGSNDGDDCLNHLDLSRDFFPSRSVFSVMVSEYQELPKFPSPAELQDIFLKCKENTYYGEVKKNKKELRKQNELIASRKRVPKHLFKQVLRRNSECLVTIISSLEKFLETAHSSGKVFHDSHIEQQFDPCFVPIFEHSNKSVRVVPKSDWNRVLLHVVCAWHGYSTTTLRQQQTERNLPIVSINFGRKLRDFITENSLSNYLLKELSLGGDS